ncbi:hypothetical protein U3516DRAFT_762745 [Neocallimastix sp. 'constans']
MSGEKPLVVSSPEQPIDINGVTYYDTFGKPAFYFPNRNKKDGRLCEIYFNNKLIATVNKKKNPQNFNETDFGYTYVQVAPGVDTAYIIALVYAYAFDLNVKLQKLYHS